MRTGINKREEKKKNTTTLFVILYHPYEVGMNGPFKTRKWRIRLNK